jgi:hypothetical protein
MSGHLFAMPILLALFATCLYDMYRGLRMV